MNRIVAIIIVCVVALIACNPYRGLPEKAVEADWKVKRIPASAQFPDGDAEAGYDYLVYGDYIGSGIPWSFIEKKQQKFSDTVLNREGAGEHMPYVFNVFDSPNGVTVTSGNCFTCHASAFRGEVVLGLGNSFSDFTKGMGFQADLLSFLVRTRFGKKSPEWEAFQDYEIYTRAITPYIKPPNPGVNPAFRLEEGCFRMRDETTLTPSDLPNFDMIRYTLASDVPPLWNVKKKHALYYNGMGRGDFRKLLMQASVLGIPDSAEAGNVLESFGDVYAWLHSLEPPPYPGKIDPQLADKGKVLFESHCSKCHGTYGDKETYPNKLVSLDVVKTDPYYARYFTTTANLAQWYNESWFAQTAPQSRMEPSDGYIAPPLDGIWATAPYLHNASVPTLDALLNSPSRPTFWQRSGDSGDFDFESVGWRYTRRNRKGGKWTYDTTLPGYGNQGHTFGDKLTDEERKAVIEYVKGL